MTIRILHVLVQPVLVEDDGELKPGPQTQPQTLTLSQLVEFAATLPEQIAGLNAAHEEQSIDHEHEFVETVRDGIASPQCSHEGCTEQPRGV